MRCFIVSLSALIGLVVQLSAVEARPKEWIDPDTGHRVIRLSTEPRMASLYFHQNGFARSGDKMVMTTSNGLAVVNLRTLEVSRLFKGNVRNVVVGKKSRQVYFTTNGVVLVTKIDTGETRVITTLPQDIRRPSGFTINADETLLAGSFTEGGRRFVPPPELAGEQSEDDDKTPPPLEKPRVAGGLQARYEARLPMLLFTINTANGAIRTFNRDTNWLNHVQFSPTDPNLIMFAHEGPWHKVDRIWTIRTDGTGLKQIHKREMDMEIAGHEFFDPSGKIIWYDLQTPRSKEFWFAGTRLKNGEQIRYPLKREQWSVHYNVSPNGKLFAGDGGGPKSVAAPGNGQWIYLFTPDFKNSTFAAEKLVNMKDQDYQLEPNVQFTPDNKWIVFRGNFEGSAQTYMVELEKSK